MKKSAILLYFLLCVCGAAAGQVQVTHGLINQWEITGGKIYHGQILIENKGDRITQVKISKEARSSRSNLDWISIDPQRLELGPGSKAGIQVTIRVPENPGKGSRWSSINIEPLPASKGGLSVVLVYGCSVITHAPGGKKDLKFLSAEYSQGKVQVRIQNTGDYVMELKTELEIHGHFLRGPLRRSFPGYKKTIEFSVDLDPGQHSAKVYFLSGEKLWTFQVELKAD